LVPFTLMRALEDRVSAPGNKKALKEQVNAVYFGDCRPHLRKLDLRTRPDSSRITVHDFDDRSCHDRAVVKTVAEEEESARAGCAIQVRAEARDLRERSEAREGLQVARALPVGGAPLPVQGQSRSAQYLGEKSHSLRLPGHSGPTGR